MTVDPLACGRTWHPTMPNVQDLAAENATLRAAVDKLVIELARCRGVSEDVIRVRRGLPAGNPWTTRRQNTPETAPVRPRDGLVVELRTPAPSLNQDAPGMDYAI